MNNTNSLIPDAELFLTQEGKPLPESALDAVTAQPWVNIDERLLEAKKALLVMSPSPELDLLLAKDGAKLSDHQLDAVTVQPWIDQDAVIQEIKTRALEGLKHVA